MLQSIIPAFALSRGAAGYAKELFKLFACFPAKTFFHIRAYRIKASYLLLG
jgi:hypothetical protein